MSRPSKAIPGLAVGDTVWLADWWKAIPARVLCAYKTTGKALVAWGDAQPATGAIYYFNESVQWWRTEAEAKSALREKRRAHLVRSREEVQRELRRTLEARAVEMRRSEEREACINAQLAELDAALAELDAEVQS